MFQLEPHQQKAVEIFTRFNRFALFWEMRVGKTAPILAHLRNLFMANKVKKAVVITSPSGMADWPKQTLMFFPEGAAMIYTGGRKNFVDFAQSDEPGVFLLSWSVLNHKSKSNQGKDISKYVFHTDFPSIEDPKSSLALENNNSSLSRHHGINFLCLDESQGIRNNAHQTRCCMMLSRRMEYRYLLTGTPIGGDVMDYWYQLNFLNPGCLGSSQSWFKRTYGFQIMDSEGRLKTYINSEGHELIRQQLVKWTWAKDLKSVSKRPPKKEIFMDFVEASGEQLQLIEQLKRDFVLEHQGEVIKAVTAWVAMMKISQILQGHCKTKDGGLITLAENPKLDWLEDYIKNHLKNEKTVIWSVFIGDMVQIKGLLNRLGVGYVHYKSGSSTKKRRDFIELFRSSPNRKVFLAHPGSAGTGVDLSVAPTNIFYSRNFDYLQMKQAASRSQSMISPDVKIIELIVKGTHDHNIYRRLMEKGRISKEWLSKSFKEEFKGVTTDF